jgi:RimJ/RimL family protein N-acetyltransferase
MGVRGVYSLDLKSYRSCHEPALPHMEMRAPSTLDVPSLAELMLDAYRGAVDYSGETVDEMTDEAQSYFDGVHGAPILECSWLYLVDGILVSACLVGWWDDIQKPLVYYIMTHPDWKGKGLGTAVLHKSIGSLVEHGYIEVRAVITEGNTPSETIFRRAGFQLLDKFTV